MEGERHLVIKSSKCCPLSPILSKKWHHNKPERPPTEKKWAGCDVRTEPEVTTPMGPWLVSQTASSGSHLFPVCGTYADPLREMCCCRDLQGCLYLFRVRALLQLCAIPFYTLILGAIKILHHITSFWFLVVAFFGTFFVVAFFETFNEEV